MNIVRSTQTEYYRLLMQEAFDLFESGHKPMAVHKKLAGPALKTVYRWRDKWQQQNQGIAA